MATLKGLIDFEGTLGGINAYTLNGKRVLRQNRSSEKEKIKTGDNYIRTRENNMEFSGAVAAAKVLRLSLMPIVHSYVDHTFTGRLQGEYRKMIATASGIRGQRSFKPLLHAAAIREIPFNEVWHLDSVLRIKPVITANTERTAATLSMAAFNPLTDLFAPAGATHVELIYATAVQPAFEYDTTIKKYKRSDGSEQYGIQTISSGVLSLSDETVDLVLPASPIDISALDKDNALISILGIRFHQQIGFKTYLLETGKVMGFVEVS